MPVPDLADTFDVDSEAFVVAGKAPTLAAELQALTNISGGIALAYKLMPSSPHQHVNNSLLCVEPVLGLVHRPGAACENAG